MLLAATLLVTLDTYAQQDPIYSQYMNNLQSVNPAYTGVRGVASISSIYRKQWRGIDAPPTTSSVTFCMPIDSLHTGIGVDFIYDLIDPVARTSLFFDYGYRVQLNNNSHLSFGLKAGFNYMQAQLSKLYRHDEYDPYIINYGDFNRFMPNVGVGAFWYNEKSYFGFSAPRLLQNKFNDKENTIYAASREERHYFLHAAFMLPVNDKIVFKPAVTTIMVAGSPITADFDASFMFANQFWVGAMYRISDAVGAYMQYEYQNMKLGFAYDFTHTRLGKNQNGTFEVMLRIDFKSRGSQIYPSRAF